MQTQKRFFKVYNYFVSDQVARGSFSVLRLAYDNQNFFPCAMKIINKKQVAKLPPGVEVEFSESKIFPILDHPNIVPIREVVETRSQIFQIMEFFPHSDLMSYIMEHKPSTQLIIQFLEQIISSIDYIHSHYLCHRDIKPENILISDKLEPLLSDFGFSNFAIEPNTGTCGSYGYSAPEIFQHQSYDGIKADIWSLGVSIYTIFSGVCPFLDHQNSITFPLHLNMSHIPSDFIPLIESCLKEDPLERPSIIEIESRYFPNLYSKLHKSSYSSKPYDFSLPITTFDPNVVHYCSLMLLEPQSKIIQQISEPQISKIKIIYKLVEQHFEKKGIIHLKDSSRHTNCQSLSLPESFYTLKIECLSETSPDSQLFNVSPLEVYQTLKKFLFSQAQKFCISNTSNQKLLIVLNSSSDDAQIETEILPGKDINKSIIIMHPNEPGINYELQIMEYLRSHLSHL